MTKRSDGVSDTDDGVSNTAEGVLDTADGVPDWQGHVVAFLDELQQECLFRKVDEVPLAQFYVK